MVARRNNLVSSNTLATSNATRNISSCCKDKYPVIAANDTRESVFAYEPLDCKESTRLARSRNRIQYCLCMIIKNLSVNT